MASDLTKDAFLGGRITMAQPTKGYRAGVDPVILAAAVRAQPGQTVLELGCGAGVALLCLGARVADLGLTGVELQSDYAALATQNAAANALAANIITADLRALPPELRNQTFYHVMANPPYFDRRNGTGSSQPGRDIAFGGETPLSDWVEVATRRLRPKGTLTMIQRIERLPDLLCAMDDRLGSIVARPISGRVGRAADRVLVSAIKGGRAAFRLTAPLILHQGDRHERDTEDYTPAIHAVLREGAALPPID